MPPFDATSTTTPESGSDDVQSRLERALFPEPVANKAPETDTSEIEEDTVEADETAETDDTVEDDTAEEGETENEGEEIELSPAQLAAILGIDENSLIVEDDGTVSLQTKVDGQLDKVNLNTLIKERQLEAHTTRKSQQLAEQMRAFEAQKQEAVAEFQRKTTELTAVMKIAEDQLTREYNSIDWDALRRQDPAEWTAKRQEFADRVQSFNAAKAKAYENVQQQAAEVEQENQTKREAYLQKQAEAVVEKLPEWKDPQVATREFEKLSSFLSSTYGFEPQDISRVEDHRTLLLAMDAMKYRQSQEKISKATKRVVNLPKIQKPGAKMSAQAANRQKQNEKRIRLKQTGNVKDAAAIIYDRMR